MSTLHTIATQLVAHPKGILAADESLSTIQKRFDQINIEATPEQRLAYRVLQANTPDLSEYVTGMILFEETLSSEVEGVRFGQYLKDRGIIPIIKVDTSTEVDPDNTAELVTTGIDTLEERLKTYVAQGAQAAKWRAVFLITDELPTERNVAKDAALLATYARLCQDTGIVPMVEPEVLMEGDHTLERCAEVTEYVLHQVFFALEKEGVDLQGIILKPNMVVPGHECTAQYTDAQIAEATVSVLRKSVPDQVAGIAFLSGGQSELDAAGRLNEINKIGGPWPLTFSFSRALLQPALLVWQGKSENIAAAQKALFHRVQMASRAVEGQYMREME